ncbi:MAG: ribonuclease P protein component [Spirochaetaceae bacterium]|jgi:ribonuclease P protein component|nr:ribonuclease P protein component [Spirochaetaceae bacterium]
MTRRTFPSAERLKKSCEITAVFNNGVSVSCPGAKLFFKQNELECNRIACAFSRKFGNAVKRNKARRLGREAYRHIRQRLKKGYDLVLLVYPDENACYDKRAKQLEFLLDKALLLGQNIPHEEAGILL